MTELTDPPRRVGTGPDEALERSLSRMGRHLEPDPLFRRQLRSVIVNRHVAVREGLHREPDRPGRRMGQLGRACLYASFVLAASTSSVMAASEQALPGDLLYPIKREIEELRLLVLPAHLHDELQAAMLVERIDEIRRLAAAGEWTAVTELATEVGALGDAATELDGTQLTVLGEVVSQLPAPARSTVEDAIEDAGISVVAPTPTPDTGGGGHDDDDDDEPNATSTPSPAPTNSPTPTISPSATPSPAPTSSPTPTISPSPTPSPSPTISPSPTPEPPNDGD